MEENQGKSWYLSFKLINCVHIRPTEFRPATIKPMIGISLFFRSIECFCLLMSLNTLLQIQVRYCEPIIATAERLPCVSPNGNMRAIVDFQEQHSNLQYSFAFIFQLEGSVVLRDLHRAACPLSGQWNMMLLVRMHSAQRRLPPRHQWLVFAEMPPIVRHNQVKVASKLSKPNIPFILSP